MTDCPVCESTVSRALGDGLFRCSSCGAYYNDDIHTEAVWEPSALHRTRDKREWSDDQL